MKKSNFFKALFLLPMTACSLGPAGNTPSVHVDFAPMNTPSTDVLVSLLDRPGSQATSLSTPTAMSDFNCLGVMVTGPQIAPNDAVMNYCPVQVTPGMPVPGIMAGLVSRTNGGSVDIAVPGGPSRMIQVFGMQSTVGCPNLMQVFATKNPGPSAFGGPYELAKTVVDVYTDTAVSLRANFTPLLSKKLFDCGNGTSGSGGSCSLANSWQELDTFQFTSAQDTVLSGIAVRPNGEIFASGVGNDNIPKNNYIVRKIPLGGGPVNVRTFQLTASMDSGGKGIGFAPNGDIFSVGFGIVSGPQTKWLVSKSTDNGGSWGDFQYSLASGTSTAMGFASDGTALYSSGYGTSGGLLHWIVLKSTDSGAAWSLADDFQLNPSYESLANRIRFLNGSLFVVGTGTASLGIKTWVIKKFASGSWSVVDSVPNTASLGFEAMDIGFSGGNLYAVGYKQTATGDLWIVRKSPDMGITWATVDSFQESTGGSRAKSVAFDNSGNIYVGGYSADATSHFFWNIRKSTDGGSTWSTFDRFDTGATTANTAWGVQEMVKDNAGALVVGGNIIQGAKSAWKVRRLPCVQ